jgi:AdoMet-dependent heme synthase
MNTLTSLARKAHERNVPLSSHVELLSPCHLKCPHCYVTHNKKNVLTLPVLEDLFEQMAAAGSFFLTLTGGEIALRKDLFDIIAAARRRFLAVKLFSTGTLWGAPEWDRLAELGVEDVRMSLYAMEPEVHDAVTLTPGSHERTMATAAGLRERGVGVSFSCPILSTNAASVPAVLDYGASIGATIGTSARIVWSDRDDPRPASTKATYDQLVSLFHDTRMKELFVSDEETCTPWDPEATCAIGRVSTFVQSTGDVLPCGNWPRSGGNILETRYLDIWRNSPEFAYARSITRKHLTGCTSCGDREECSPCPAMNLRETGDVASPSLTVCTETAVVSALKHGESRQTSFRRSRLPIVA